MHPKKILVVAMPFSLHSVKWVSLLQSGEFQFYLFPSMQYTQPHAEFSNVTFYSNLYTIDHYSDAITYKGIDLLGKIKLRSKPMRILLGKLCRVFGLESSYEKQFVKVVNKLKPDIIHTMETQHAGYLLGECFNSLNYKPVWVHTLWGIDLDFYLYLAEHKKRIKNILQKIRVLIVEGDRDLKLSREHGFKGIIKRIQATGGLDIDYLSSYNLKKTSQRTLLMVRGDQDLLRWSLLPLIAIKNCYDKIGANRIIFYSVSKDMEKMIENFNNRYGLNIEILAPSSSDEFVELLANARVSVINNYSDGMPNTMLEGMLLGAFPIVSSNSLGREVLEHGKSGYIVDPGDISALEKYILAAMIDDEMVDTASSVNHLVINGNYNSAEIKKEVYELYNQSVNIDYEI